MTDYDFRQHIGEWVETRSGDCVKVIGCNSEAPEYCQLVVQCIDGDISTRYVNGAFTEHTTNHRFDLVPPAREYTTRVKLWRWDHSGIVTTAPEHRWCDFENHEDGKWISEPTEVTFKLLPRVKLP